MISICRNCSGRRTAYDFRKIELLFPRVTSRDHVAAHRIKHPVRETSMSQLKISRILMQQGRQNRTGHEILDGTVGEGCGIPLSITCPALTISGFTVLRLIDPRQEGIPRILHVIEAAANHDSEFLLGR